MPRYRPSARLLALLLALAAGTAAAARAATERRALRRPATLHLGTFAFDPLGPDPAARFTPAGASPAAAPPRIAEFVVQFSSPIRQTDLDALAAAGLDLVQFVPHGAYLVRGTAETIERARRAAGVRAVVPYRPAHKLPAELLWAVGGRARAGAAEYGRSGRASYDLAIAKRAPRAALEAAVAEAGGALRARLELPASFFDLLRVELPPEAVAALAARPGVLRIDPYVPPAAEDERAAQIVAGNYSGPTAIAAPGYDPAALFGVDGTGVTVAIADDGIGIPGDGGFYLTAANAVDGPLRGAPSGALGHGHLNATIVAGAAPFGALDALGYNYGLGVAPGAHVVNIPILYTASYTGTDADAANDAVTTAGPNGATATISNNSWGDGTNGNAYDALAATYDALARDASTASSIDPLLFVFSAGNVGTSGLTRPKMAKNVVAVAASENLRATLPTVGGSTGSADNLEEIPDFSSRGPAADGRIKPDLTAPGAAVAGGRSGPNSLFGNLDAHHRHSSGTSHAAPQVAGAAALFTERWRNDHGGDRPSPALIKAALVASAVEVTGAGASAPVPNGAEGWGRVHLGNLLGAGARVLADEAVLLDQPGDGAVFTFEVADGTGALRATLVWSDPPALGDPALVNDLDLELVVAGERFLGNRLSGGLSVAGGAPDARNNVESVYFAPAAFAAGTPFAVRVRAAELNGDGALGEGDATDQRFALVVENAAASPLPFVLARLAAIAAESCAPANGAADPGEYLTATLCLENLGTAATGDLLAALAASAAVDPLGGAQSFGALAAGEEACRDFAFAVTPGAACGEPIALALQLADAAPFAGYGATTLGAGELVPNDPVTVANPAAVEIPSLGAAAPYPALLAVAGSGTIVDLDLLLSGFGHGRPEDVDLRLVAPDGTAATLFSDAGGTSHVTGRDLVLDDEASGPLPEAPPLPSGSYQPTDNQPYDAMPAPAPPSDLALLAAFDGLAPSGSWQLFVADDASGDDGELAGGWALRFTLAHPVCAADCTLLFADGFERGDPSRWSSSEP